jgi:hypothetical protein
MVITTGNNQGKLESYGKTGPYGEALWYLLRDVKRQFIDSLISHWESVFGWSRVPMVIREALESRLDRAREESDGLMEWWRAKISESWPSSSKRGRPSVTVTKCVERRQELFYAYLDRCRSFAGMLSPQAADENSTGLGTTQRSELTRKTLALCVGSLIWPYYFFRVDDPAGKELIYTWMPNFDVIRLSYFGKDSHNSPGNLLYPSLYGLLENDSTRNDKFAHLIAGGLRKWLDLGSSDIDSEADDIGHVQPFHDDGRASVYMPNLWERSHKRSRFSDVFYFNRDAYRWYDYGSNAGNSKRRVVGVLFWCSPVDGLLLDLMRPDAAHPVLGIRADIDGNDESHAHVDRVRTLAALTDSAWRFSDGPVIARSLQKRYEDTNRLVIDPLESAKAEEERQKLLVTSTIVGWTNHDIGNLIHSAHLTGLPDTPEATLRFVPIVLRAVRALTNTLLFPETSTPQFRRWESLFAEVANNTEGNKLDLAVVMTRAFANYIQRKKLALRFSFDELRGREVNVLLPAILFELARNICRHTDQFSMTTVSDGELTLRTDDDGNTSITSRSSLHKITRMRNLYACLPQSKDHLPQKGVSFVLALLNALGPSSRPVCLWRFVPRAPMGSGETTRLMNDDQLWAVEVPTRYVPYVKGEARLGSQGTVGEKDPIDARVGDVFFESAPLLLAVKQ